MVQILFFAALIGFCVVIPCMRLWNLSIKPMINEVDESMARANATFDEDDGVLVLKKRTPELAKVIKIVDDKNYTLGYRPEEYIYTSVTVGGVTTGGISKIGAEEYVSGGKKTGKCQLRFAGKMIRAIQLDESMFALAKTDPVIKGYLDEKKKQIQVVVGVGLSKMAMTMMQTGNTGGNHTALINQVNSDARAGFPTKEKCIAIMNWLCCV